MNHVLPQTDPEIAKYCIELNACLFLFDPWKFLMQVGSLESSCTGEGSGPAGGVKRKWAEAGPEAEALQAHRQLIEADCRKVMG